MQQNVLPRSLSTNNLLYLCDAKQATVNNYDKSNSDASAETEMWTYNLIYLFVSRHEVHSMNTHTLQNAGW